MRRIQAKNCRALLVLLLFGFFAATLHAGMHLQPDTQGCAFCSGHSSPMHAVVPATSDVVFTPMVESAPPPVRHSFSSRSFRAYRQRGPPQT
jgi:hypothetical protein